MLFAGSSLPPDSRLRVRKYRPSRCRQETNISSPWAEEIRHDMVDARQSAQDHDPGPPGRFLCFMACFHRTPTEGGTAARSRLPSSRRPRVEVLSDTGITHQPSTVVTGTVHSPTLSHREGCSHGGGENEMEPESTSDALPEEDSWCDPRLSRHGTPLGAPLERRPRHLHPASASLMRAPDCLPASGSVRPSAWSSARVRPRSGRVGAAIEALDPLRTEFAYPLQGASAASTCRSPIMGPEPGLTSDALPEEDSWCDRRLSRHGIPLGAPLARRPGHLHPASASLMRVVPQGAPSTRRRKDASLESSQRRSRLLPAIPE